MVKYLLILITLFYLHPGFAQVPCSVDNLQIGPATNGYLQAFTSGSNSFVYFDISGTGGTSPGCSGLYPYLIENVTFKVADLGYFTDIEPPTPGNASVTISIVQMATPGNPCAGPGAPVFQGPNINFSVGDTLYEFTQPVNIYVNGPFFVKFQMESFSGDIAQVPTLIWDNVVRPPCRQWFSNGLAALPYELVFSPVGWIDMQVEGQSSFPAPSKVQIFHNSADQALQTIDVRIDGALPNSSFDNMNFRSSSSFVEIESDQTITITINDASSVDDSNPLFSQDLTIGPGYNYIIGMSGILSTTGYTPSSIDAPFGFSIFDQGRITSTVLGNTDLIGFNGISDAPELDLNRLTPPAIPISSDMVLGEFGSYTAFETNNFSVEISDNGNQIQDYSALLDNWNLENQAITICASGFMNPSMNSNGPLFGLWAALPAGGPMLELPFINGIFEEAPIPEFSIYPNPTNDFFIIQKQNQMGSQIEIFDGKGALHLSQKLILANDKIGIGKLSPGLYYILLTDKAGILSGRQKLIITSR